MPFVREIIKKVLIDLSSAMALRTEADVRVFTTYEVKCYTLGASPKTIQLTGNFLVMTPRIHMERCKMQDKVCKKIKELARLRQESYKHVNSITPHDECPHC